MFVLEENHLEWALKHLSKYYHSDFYPRAFEFKAIAHNWQNVKKYLMSLDIEKHTPKSPMIELAQKYNGNYRTGHQLDPIDSLIYTALIYAICEIIEKYRIPVEKEIVCSFRIKPDLEGAFFTDNSGWETFLKRSSELAKKYPKGFVIIADITDYYNQIYTHRIRSLIEAAGEGNYDQYAQIIENFIMLLNKKTSRGIPVGPVPSILLSELILADIDRKICSITDEFVRYADDMHIFFKKREDAVFALHEITKYLYSSHRLVCSGEKTKIVPCKDFLSHYLKDEEKLEQQAIIATAEKEALGQVEDMFSRIPYAVESYSYEEEYEKALAEIMKNDKFMILVNTYSELFSAAIKSAAPDYGLIRHLLRKAARYRIKKLIPIVLDNFEKLLPVLRETIVYINSVIDENIVLKYKSKFEIIMASYYMKLPFVNLWMSYLLQNAYFNKINLPRNYDAVLSMRSKALIALRRNDDTLVKSLRDSIDSLGPWDRRAVLFSASLLPLDEMRSWVTTIAAGGDIVDESIASLLISSKKKAGHS